MMYLCIKKTRKCNVKIICKLKENYLIYEALLNNTIITMHIKTILS